MFYRGPSNISDDKGGDLEVELRYGRRSAVPAVGKPVESGAVTPRTNSASTCSPQNT